MRLLSIGGAIENVPTAVGRAAEDSDEGNEIVPLSMSARPITGAAVVL